jgi:8-amino-3,8-dideoxy-alpha-D-manno-octulosonate transaminase
MAGSDIFDDAELKAVEDVIKRKMVHRYSSHAQRKGQYRVDEFENKAKTMTGAKYALALSSGSAALVVMLKGMGIGAGDEVITTPFTFIATVEAIVACNAVPVLGEIDETLSLDPDSVEKLITKRTKAIMPVHMFGCPADMDRFIALGKKYDIPIIEDACEVVGGTYKGRYLGTIGYCGAWSFDPNKSVTTGEGGMALTDDKDLYYRMDGYADQGHIHRKDVERGEEGISCLGVNYRLSELHGALGLVALDKIAAVLDKLRATKKKILDAVADTGLKVRPMNDAEGETATHIIFLLPTAEAAKKFQAAAKAAGCGCGIIADNTWHYAKNWKVLEEMGGKDFFGVKTPSYSPESMAKSTAILERAVMFGIGVTTSDADIEKMVSAIKAGAKAAL